LPRSIRGWLGVIRERNRDTEWDPPIADYSGEGVARLFFPADDGDSAKVGGVEEAWNGRVRAEPGVDHKVAMVARASESVGASTGPYAVALGLLKKALRDGADPMAGQFRRHLIIGDRRSSAFRADEGFDPARGVFAMKHAGGFRRKGERGCHPENEK